jgi:replicative DNA helicase
MNLSTDRKNKKPPARTKETYNRVPPHATELEMAVLGALMLEKDTFDRVSEVLHEDCFYIEANRLVFRAMSELNRNNANIDELTVVNELIKMEQLQYAGGRIM